MVEPKSAEEGLEVELEGRLYNIGILEISHGTHYIAIELLEDEYVKLILGIVVSKYNDQALYTFNKALPDIDFDNLKHKPKPPYVAIVKSETYIKDVTTFNTIMQNIWIEFFAIHCGWYLLKNNI